MPDFSDYLTIIGTESGNLIEGSWAKELIYGRGGNDTIYGNGGNDALFGEAGNDRLYGGFGDDILSGGGGTDVLDGGDGLDIVWYVENTTPVRVDLTTGRVSFPGKPWPTETLHSIEGAHTGSGADILIGNVFDNVFDGGAGNDMLSGDAGDDILEGGAGNDTLSGGAGDDILEGGGGTDAIDGGAGSDTVLYTENTSAVRVDLALGRVTFPGRTWPAESLASIENATTGSGNDTLIGNGVANVLRGGAGADVLQGGGGNDVLEGGEGNDSLLGGAGADVIYLGSSETLILQYDGEGPLPVPPSYGIDAVNGGTGIDTLAFADVYVRAEDYELSRPPSMIVDLGLGQVRVKGVSGPASSITAVENVTTSSGDDRVFGSSGNNVIRLGDGLNQAFGGAGDDTIHGGEWAYSYYPGIGGDPSSGFQEVLSGGAGNDTIFGNGAYWLYVEGNIAIVDRATERLDGGAGNDRLVTGLADATLSGGSGADRFEFRDEYWHDEREFFPDGFDHTVTDFDPTEGDKLVFSMLDMAPGAPDPIFVGEADFASLDVNELGYRVEASPGGGNDTVLRMKFQHEDFGPNPNILPVMTVTLRGYDAGLSADDILFA